MMNDSADELRERFEDLKQRMSRLALPAHELSDGEKVRLRTELDILEASIESLEWWPKGNPL
jgi:hypothetical protein